MRAISVDRMSHKDAGTKQAEDDSDFNHFGAPISRSAHFIGFFAFATERVRPPAGELPEAA